MKDMKRFYHFALLVIIVIYTSSLAVSFIVPYCMDDVDHLATLVEAIESKAVGTWLFTPHNEHIMPVLKSAYYLFYKIFYLNSAPFHWMIIFACVFTMVLIYKLLFLYSGSGLTAILGVALWAGTNLLDSSLTSISNSHMAFCAVFYLLLFSSMSRYFMKDGDIWIYVIILALVALPFTFALGALSIFLALLYYWFCIKEKDITKSRKFFVFLVSIWMLTMIPYIMNISSSMYLAHYTNYSKSSALDGIDFVLGFKNIYYYYIKFLPFVFFPLKWVSFSLFMLAVIMVAFCKNKEYFKKIGFFILLSFVVSFLVMMFRGQIANLFKWSRYHVFTVLSVSMIIPLIIGSVIEKSKLNNRFFVDVLVFVFCFFWVAYTGIVRYQHLSRYSNIVAPYINDFYFGYNELFLSFFDENPEIQKVHIKDLEIVSPPYPMSIKISRYALFLIPVDVRKKIVWSDKTDIVFLEFMHSKLLQGEYLFMKDILEE